MSELCNHHISSNTKYNYFFLSLLILFFFFFFLNLSCFCFSGAWLYLLLIFRQIYTNKHFWNRFERFICKSPSKGFLFSAKTIINIFDAARVQNSYIHNEKIKKNRKIKLWKFSMRLFHDEWQLFYWRTPNMLWN